MGNGRRYCCRVLPPGQVANQQLSEVPLISRKRVVLESAKIGFASRGCLKASASWGFDIPQTFYMTDFTHSGCTTLYNTARLRWRSEAPAVLLLFVAIALLPRRYRCRYNLPWV